MSDEIITAESLQTDEAGEQQDKVKVDSPDESKDENLETIKSEDDAHESDEPEAETPEVAEESAENADTQTDTDESEEEQEVEEKSEKPEIPKWAEKRLLRERRKHEREMGELQKKVDQQIANANQQNAPTYDPATQIQNPFTGEIVDINSVPGQVAIQLTQASQVQEAVEKQQKTEEAQKNLHRKLEKGRDKYDDFDDVTENAGITLPMLNAAYLSDNTAELLYNLVKYKPEEIDRISKLSPELQGREMAFLEVKMKHANFSKNLLFLAYS